MQNQTSPAIHAPTSSIHASGKDVAVVNPQTLSLFFTLLTPPQISDARRRKSFHPSWRQESNELQRITGDDHNHWRWSLENHNQLRCWGNPEGQSTDGIMAQIHGIIRDKVPAKHRNWSLRNKKSGESGNSTSCIWKTISYLPSIPKDGRSKDNQLWDIDFFFVWEIISKIKVISLCHLWALSLPWALEGPRCTGVRDEVKISMG